MTNQNDLEEHLLVDLHELLIPLLDIRGLLAGIGLLVGRLDGVVAVVLAPLDDLLQDSLVHLYYEDLAGVLQDERLVLVRTYVHYGNGL